VDFTGQDGDELFIVSAWRYQDLDVALGEEGSPNNTSDLPETFGIVHAYDGDLFRLAFVKNGIAYTVQTRRAERNLHPRDPQFLALHLRDGHGRAIIFVCPTRPRSMTSQKSSRNPRPHRHREKGFATAKHDIADVKNEIKGGIAPVQEQVNSIETELSEHAPWRPRDQSVWRSAASPH
jgi:hypothetical protein